MPVSPWLVFMAIVRVLVRTFALGSRASRLPDATADRVLVLTRSCAADSGER